MNKTLAFVFPGQGSQQLGMLSDLAQEHAVVKATFAESSAVLGYDLWDLIQNDPESLGQTDKTQPALLTSSVALWRLWQEQGGELPSLLAGHSLGEYSALVCAQVIKFSEAVDLVRLRGEYMQQAVPVGHGAMAAVIGLDDQSVIDACASVSGVVSAVNFNSPGQVVIAGETAAVTAAMDVLKSAGAKRVLPLPVSVPSHCRLMLPAGQQLAAKLENILFAAPKIAVVQNVNARIISDPEILKANLVSQLSEPVLWTQTVENLAQMGISATIECGPGKVLSGLNKRIVKNLVTHSIGDLASFETVLQQYKSNN